MKHHLRDQILKRREYDIIKFIKQKPYCTLNNIFTKGKVPKSKATVELVKNLVSQNLVNVDLTGSYYYTGEMDLLKEFEICTREIENDLKKNPAKNNHLMTKIVKFCKLRIRILRAEKKHNPDIDFRDTLEIFAMILNYQKNPSRFMEIVLLDQLSFAIKDDEYYLGHQLHSKPREYAYPFQKAKKRHLRRSTSNLLEMRKKGRHEFSLNGADFDKNMEKLTNDPRVWLDRAFAEKNRTLYQNPPEMIDEIFKKCFSKKVNPNVQMNKKMKAVFDKYKKTFPRFPIKAFMEAMNKEDLDFIKQVAEESGMDFDGFVKRISSEKYISPDTFRTSRISP